MGPIGRLLMLLTPLLTAATTVVAAGPTQIWRGVLLGTPPVSSGRECGLPSGIRSETASPATAQAMLNFRRDYRDDDEWQKMACRTCM